MGRPVSADRGCPNEEFWIIVWQREPGALGLIVTSVVSILRLVSFLRDELGFDLGN